MDAKVLGKVSNCEKGRWEFEENETLTRLNSSILCKEGIGLLLCKRPACWFWPLDSLSVWLNWTPCHSILSTRPNLLSCCFLRRALCASCMGLLACSRYFMFFHHPVLCSACSVKFASVCSSVCWCLTDFLKII